MQRKNQLPVSAVTLILTAVMITAVFVLNSWVTHNNSGQQQNPFAWEFEIATNLISWLLWAGLLPLVFAGLNRIIGWQQPLIARILILLILSVLIAAIHRYAALVGYIAYYWLQSGNWLDAFGSHSISWVVRGTIPGWIQLTVMVLLIFGINSYQEKQKQALKLSQLNQQLSNAELNALKMQLHPHFFFNTLNTISSLMDIDIDKAQNVVAKLGQLMRTMLDSSKRQYIPLSMEIDYINDYLQIEGARFSDRLKVKFEVDDASLSATIPNLLLQPLVENSIKHGMSATSEQVEIKIRGYLEQDKLHLIVSDNGRGVGNVDYILQNPGIGIKSLQTRLEHLYQQQAELKITSGHKQGFEVMLCLPYKKWDISNGH